VGHYVGNPIHKIPNASYDMINTNNFDPRPGAGKNGNPVVIEPKDLLKMQQYFQINRFNLLASDRIPLNRSLPDFRRKKYYKKYCTTCFINFHVADVVLYLVTIRHTRKLVLLLFFITKRGLRY
jgi:hypothetical protein